MERSLQKARPSTHLGLLTAAQLSAEQPLERVHRQAVDLQYFFNPRIDVTLASIHTPPSMWGSNCEGDPFGLSRSWLPLTWELSLSRAGNPGQWEIPWPLQLAFSKQGWGEGTGGHLCWLKMWVIPSEDRIPVEKHLGKAPFYFPLLEICNQTRILKAKESCLTIFSVDFWKSVCSPTPIFSPKGHTVI